ncbi:extensin family protein [Roseovarius arcticus]|uniref:extensin-like domain-containing protein n=1 Tax=Roseovarius arcticus TaxID=2547404 RepID=UPI001110BCA2|nr:extensin family protein [Roseovarius arcticus]
MRRAAITAVLIAATSAAMAGAPAISLRPVARPDAPATVQTPLRASSPVLLTRPLSRPNELAAALPAEPTPSLTFETGSPAGGDQTDDRREDIAPPVNQGATVVTQERGGLLASLRPLLRPLAIGREASKRKEARARGMVCGDPAIQGEEIGRVPGRITGCGVDGAVKVRSIAGVALSQHATMDCGQARAMKSWLDKGMKPAVRGYGGGVAQLRIAAHYACRTRNNQRGGKISEHGKGRAIDIAGFQLRDGRTISVLNDWGEGKKGRILSRMHRSACGPFGTVLGPDANKFHRDHFHFDTARYRSGSYCR